MEPEASEFPKGIVLYRGGRWACTYKAQNPLSVGHVHIRHITHSPLVNVECYNPPPFGA